MAADPHITAAISRHIWNTKYRHRTGGHAEPDITHTWRRVAAALAEAEPDGGRRLWGDRFYQVLEDFRFVPGGRIQAGAGTGRRVTLFNCFVMGTIEDSTDGIFDALKEGALTLQQGGGVGYDFSTLRPQGFDAHAAGTVASGPVSFMQIWDAMCATLLSTGARRGAMMATLRCDHPDIETFIAAKQDGSMLRHFNLSVLVTDAFMQAVQRDEEWPLVFPAAADEPGVCSTVLRVWSGTPLPVRCRVVRTVRARALWDAIMRATYDYAEPGVLFIDRINRENNLWYRERVSATNPCGEVPLPPYGACDLGSINLVRFVRRPFTPEASFDFDGVAEVAQTAVRMLDNVIDVSRYPLEAQARQAQGSRRIGLGITGLADTLLMLGMLYGDRASLDFAARVVRTLCHAAYRASIGLAREKGPFPFFEREQYLAGPFVQSLPEDIRDGIAGHGIRNSHLIAIAPTGTISLLADNVSSSLEPVFDFAYRRRVLELDGSHTEYELRDHAWTLWQKLRPGEPLPGHFVTARQLAPETHLAMQAAVQPWVDHAISKTINIPADHSYESFKDVYLRAWEQGLKGCTTFRPNEVTGAVLSTAGDGFERALHCCDPDREAD
ncbi:MAG: adenosylcobalamin-dependent ribonucleoside-diphosphate reductase [Gammaproteobacteria bacterium]|jgi:ribonucleoside-diphosphate reductase alpha chain|nr:adenosylcobalamin-dependent ribonucleoside-diphosphate reductase [Gammaproteobacteria bacterium]